MSDIYGMVRAERRMYHELKQQNADLLEALKEIEVIGRGARPLISKGALAGDIARRAIAKAECKE